MPDRDGYIPGVPCWVDTSQPDPKAAVEFYSGLFGWECENVLPPESPGDCFMARIRGRDVAAIGSIQEGMPPMAMWNTYVWVESADETAAEVRDGGGKVLTEPFDVMDSGRMAVFMDPRAPREPRPGGLSRRAGGKQSAACSFSPGPLVAQVGDPGGE